MKPPRLPVVALLSKRTRAALDGYDGALAATERVLSSNSVTGWSVNVPIEATCQPSKVCAASCYAASNLMAATPALLRQARVLRAMREDPVAFAKRVCEEYDALGLTFVRWNGVGDLDEAAVEAINWIGANRPDVVVWVVTRIAQYAAKIAHAPGVFVHVSLDASSAARRLDFLSKAPLTQNFFFSWQCERGEVPPDNHGASVVFAHRYKVAQGADLGAASCPLNGANDCAGMCAKCRRCFSGEAVRLRVELAKSTTEDARVEAHGRDDGPDPSAELDYLDALLARQQEILTGVANALRGDPGPLASHSHHDLAERAAAVVAELAAARAATADDPLLDGTDFAHPAWWRGHERAAEMLTSQRDAALTDAARVRAAYASDLASLAGRTTPPTEAEIRSHAASGGWWLVTYANGSCDATVITMMSSRAWHEARGVTRWLPLANGRPCAWPTL